MNLIEPAAELIEEVAAAEILPRYRRLGESAIRDKGGGDLVTEADVAAEARLTDALCTLLPGSLVVGEEACAKDPRRLDALATNRWVWVIDPLDGTAHFARGEEPFGMIVALVRAGVTEMGWIHMPLGGLTATARRGDGAYLGGERVELGATPEAPRGVVLDRFFPDDLRAAFAAGFADLELTAPARCAAHHYVELLAGSQHFAMYHRTLVWDHAAGVLIATEAGAEVRRLDGSSYRPDSDASTLLVASSSGLWDRIRTRLG